MRSACVWAFCRGGLGRCTIETYMCAYERGPVAVKVYSENQKNVDDLAERLERETTLSSDQAKLVAYDLLCRKALKIKSSALAQIFRSADKDCDTKAMRDELLSAEIVTKIEGSGVNGRPAFYTINATVFEDEGPDDEEVTTFENVIAEDARDEAENEAGRVEDAPAARASRHHVDTDETLDENVVRAFTARAGRGFGGGGKRDVQRRAAQERFRAAALGHADEREDERPAKSADASATKPADDRVASKLAALHKAERIRAEHDDEAASKPRRGAHFKKEPVADGEPKKGSSVKPAGKSGDVSTEGAKRDASCRPGRGFVARDESNRSKRGNRDVEAEKVEPVESSKPADRKPAAEKSETKAARLEESQIAPAAHEERGGEEKSAPKRRRRRGSRGSGSSKVAQSGSAERDGKVVTDDEAAGHASAAAKDDAAVSSPQHDKAESVSRRQRRGGQHPATQKAAAAADTHTAEPKQAADQTEAQHAGVSAFDIARVLGRRLLKAVPTSTTLVKIREQQTQIVKVDKGDKKAAPSRPAHNDMSNRKIAEDVATVAAWVERMRGTDFPFASRRQRAYEIFNDEKAFDGKRGERLVKRLAEKGIQMSTLKVTPTRPVHFTGFYTLGADKPFIMVENLDTYDEIVKLLRGRKNAKLFGIKVGGVIFGGGCKASVSHALDDYLAEIGYRFKYVYYVGDIDREGARIVEQTRNANVTEVRLHAGMYRAMIAEHKRRVKAGGECEPAAANQGVPQNLAAVIKDLPMVTRVQFRNILRDGGRIPQEILMSADYRDGDSGSFDRMLNN